jgi:hypothetical protein
MHVLAVRFYHSWTDMSDQAHFWLRVVGLSVILALELGPRLWGSPQAPTTSTASVASVALQR